jgi:hypothetical protein
VGTFPGMWENPVRTEKPALPLYYDDDDNDLTKDLLVFILRDDIIQLGLIMEEYRG